MGELFVPAHLLILSIVAIPLLGLHFVPALVAGLRHARNFTWILMINIFLAWTVVGWVIALIWALRDEPRPVFATVPPPPYNL
jgi:hypothetical protein